MDGAPLFNTDVGLYRPLLLDTNVSYLTVSEGHVIMWKLHGISWSPKPEIIGRFQDDEHAERTLFEAGFVKNAGRFVYAPR